MTKEDFVRWKQDGKEVFNVIRNEIRVIEYQLAREAGVDSQTDRFKAGMINGMERVLDIEWEEESDQDQGS